MQVDAVLAEIERLETADQKVPARVPTTDPQSRITPNKDGGFAPNYTPTATVDVDSGLVVAADVIANTDEDKHMIQAVKDVMDSFSLEHPPEQLLADGMMCTGENLAECKSLGIDFYSPIKLGAEGDNHAQREDPSQAIPPEDIAHLPTTTKRRNGTTTTQFNKNAFVYDKEKDCYWCPAGVEHARKMAEPESKKKYGRRRHAGERPFATIKSQFGARGFLIRGLAKVSCEWHWLTAAFNLHRLMGLISGGTGPPKPEVAS